jgi:hypothetical protein
MRLQDVCVKYRISDSFLNSKEDGLKVAAKSIDDIIAELKQKNQSPDTIIKLNRLKDFLLDVKNSSF